jgi:leukotriene-A4 hydrolase
MLELKANPEDVNTYSNFQEIIQRKVDLEVDIDFEKKSMFGNIKTTYEILNQSLENIILDLHGPEISSVSLVNEEYENINLDYSIYDKNEDKEALGTPLVINLSALKDKYKKEYDNIFLNKNIIISIDFKTNENCNGIQYLTKEQTRTKSYPFMFTQCEAILCRTLFPIQDTPSVKSTYKVKTSISSPLTFLFGGILKSHYYDCATKKKINYFEQNIPIPSYLVAFVAGELEFAKISNRCGVWTEKGLASLAAKEFIDAEKYIEIAEKYLNHPYEWKIYNILVLPFSFPFGGMENPNLTFVTPALLAGDKSMSNVIGHEISHSWTGNLVTNKNWKNFWVNEGFTKFMERKLDKILLGEEMSKLESIVGNNSLISAIKIFGEDSHFTSLSPDYTGIDPDDGFSTIPYEKGYQFLCYLEEKVGEDNFQKIMGNYIEKYKYKSVDWTDFKSVYEEFVKQNYEGRNARKILNVIDWDKWVTEKGFPSYKMEFKSKYTEEVDQLINKFINKENNKENALELFKEWHTNVKLVFFERILKNLENFDESMILEIKKELNLVEDYNDDIKAIWYEITLQKGMKDEIENVKNFLKTHGRLKYLKPLYFSWIKLDLNDSMAFFEENKIIYHPIARRLIQNKFDSMKK